MMTASQFYVMARRLEDAYAAQMRSLCKETGVAQTAMDILLFLHNNPGYDTARDICTYRQLKPALVSLYIENLVQLGFLAREGVPGDRRKCRLVLTEAAAPVVAKVLNSAIANAVNNQELNRQNWRVRRRSPRACWRGCRPRSWRRGSTA